MTQDIQELQRSKMPEGEGRLFPDTKRPAAKKADDGGKAAPEAGGTGAQAAPGADGGKAADPTGDGKANGGEKGGKPEGQAPQKPQARFKDMADAEAYAKAKDAEVQRKNEELNAATGILARSADALRDHESLRQFREQVEPFLPEVEMIRGHRSVMDDVVVPEEEMTGVKDGVKFATEADRLRIVQSDPKLNLKYQRTLWSSFRRAEAEEIQRQQQEEGRVIAEVEQKYPEIKEPEIQSRVATLLGPKAAILKDRSLPMQVRALLLEQALETVRAQASNSLSPEEINKLAEKRALEIEKAKMLDPGSRIQPKGDAPTGQEARLVSEIDRMRSVAGEGKLPYDKKHGR
jgi:hypothetical protein